MSIFFGDRARRVSRATRRRKCLCAYLAVRRIDGDDVARAGKSTRLELPASWSLRGALVAQEPLGLTPPSRILDCRKVRHSELLGSLALRRHALVQPDLTHEDRLLILGTSARARVLFVVYVEREAD